MKRIALLFDGTWNKPGSQTNVWRSFKALVGESPPNFPYVKSKEGLDGKASGQLAHYYPGVGTKGLQRFTGGAFGNGLSANVLAGYRDLCNAYHPGDQLFIFGFSRGAYTARSLVGLIRKCGILECPTEDLLHQAYRMYRGRAPELHPDAQKPSGFRHAFSYSDEPEVQFLGVWDTVGTLGIPVLQPWIPFARKRYQFHDVELSRIVKHAYHAVATDEHREDYQPTLWMQLPEETAKARAIPQTSKANQCIEQRWFIGAHANIGGGYAKDILSSIPLAWMCARAQEHGLAFQALPSVPDDAYRAPVHDSYRWFMCGLYRLLKRNRQYTRIHDAAINETVDPSVEQRYREDLTYKPPALLKKLMTATPEE